MIRVVIADDHPLVRRGLASLMRDTDGVQLLAEVDDYPSAMRALAAHEPDVLLMDVQMPGGSALSALEQIRQSWPDVAPLVLTTLTEDAFAVRLLRAGARGFVNKSCATEELLRALRTVARGGRHVSSELAELLLLQVEGDSPAPHQNLSQREFEVFIRLASGERPTDIAEALHLSIKTISTHKRRLMEKLGTQTNADLVRYALAHELV